MNNDMGATGHGIHRYVHPLSDLGSDIVDRIQTARTCDLLGDWVVRCVWRRRLAEERDWGK